MKKNDFAQISAREYPTVHILDNQYIWGGVQFCVNLSERPYSSELKAAMTAHGIKWIHCPVSEEPGADWLQAFAYALPKMYRAYKDKKKQIVHCDMGNNRSRAFAEALYFAVRRKEYDDPYKGADNHLEYNCKIGHLPDIGEIERRIRAMIGLFPNWNMPEENEMRRILLATSPHWTRDSWTINTKANPIAIPDFPLCGTPFLQALYRAVKRFHNGEPIGEGYTVDEVEMTIYGEWDFFGLYGGEPFTKIYVPVFSVKGEEKRDHLESPEEIEGFTPVRGHEYKLKVRRIFLTDLVEYRHLELLEVVSDTLSQHHCIGL